jgi:glucose-1-phosphate cytidylyltransferase
MTGSRVKQIARYIQEDDFMLTYGDGVGDVNIAELVKFHRSHGRLGTVTAVSTPGRFGELGMTSGLEVQRFSEKPTGGSSINGGFFVFRREFLDRLPDDPACVLEKGPMEALADDRQLMAYLHTGFWQAMDTYREFVYLNELWNRGEAPWKVWK